MSLAVVLDAGPLGLLCHRRGVVPADECKEWYRSHVARGTFFFIAEITDYEVRRELLRLKKLVSLARLDALNKTTMDTFIPLSTPAMTKAANLWAVARQVGHPTADPKELDADVILAAQVLTKAFSQTQVLVATGNVAHLSMFVQAADWRTI